MFTAKNDTTNSWTDGDQYLYSLLWSAFLDLHPQSEDHFGQRFRPYSSERVAREMLWDRPEIAGAKAVEAPSFLERHATQPSAPVRLFALWTVVPTLFSPYASGGTGGRFRRQRADRSDPSETRKELREVLRRVLHTDLGVEISAFRLDADSRPILPPYPELGIEDATVDVRAARRGATATLDAVLQMPFDKDALARAIDPRSWRTFVYWRPVSEPTHHREISTIRMQICLPGGCEAAADKWRELVVDYTMTVGSFGVRVDFDGAEKPQGKSEEHVLAERAHGHIRDLDQLETHKSMPPESVHIERLRGYLALDKIPGRPGFTRFTAEREVRFASDIHDRFRVETLMFWLAYELVSFAGAHAKDAGA